MAVMIAIPSSFMNSCPNHDMTSHKLGGTTGVIHVNGMIKKKHVSSWGNLELKAPTNVNATKVGAKDWSMLDLEEKGPNMVSDLGTGRMIQDGLIFQKKICIGLYEIGPDQTASIETLMNHLVETGSNHLKKIGLMANGLGSEEMSKQNLTWVAVKIQMVVNRYPTWGKIVQIDTWKAAYGKNGLCCNLTFSDCKTGEILVRASSFWVMMNKNTRKVSKFPNEVRAKLERYFLDTPPIVEQDTRKWSKGEEIIDEHIYKGLKPRWSDMDFNQHVNHVKYTGLILESVPKTILENYEILSITLEYYRECTNDCALQSLTSILANNNGEIDKDEAVDCQHLLQFDTDGGSGDMIMKGRTRWRLKHGKSRDFRKLVSTIQEVSNTK